VLARDLDPERADRAQLREHALGDGAVAIDRVGVEPLEEVSQAGEERRRARGLAPVGLGEGIDQLHPQPAEEQLAQEARARPAVFARGLRHIAGLLGIGD